jgi:ribosomal protein S27AE
MQRNKIKRPEKFLSKIRKDIGKIASRALHKKYSFKKEENPNWKGGISKNKYHYKKIQIERYPERIDARRKVYYAVKSGKLKRGKCEVKGCVEITTFAHHEDYSKPLEVKWLCRKHHRAAHDNKH